MRNARKSLVLTSTLVAALALSACAATPGGDSDSDETKYGAIVLTRQAEFYVAYEAALKVLDPNITVLDSDIKVETQQANIENLLAKGVNAIAFSPVNDASGTPLVQQALDAGASVVTLAVPTGLAPVAVEDSFNAGKEGGVAAAEFFQDQFPGVPIKIAIISQPQLQQTVDRADGFVAGVQSVDPDAVVVADQDGGGALDTATTAAENVLQANPEANLWFGINDPSALGALNALRSAGRGTLDSVNVVVGFDGSAEGLNELLDPTSALKIELANQPIAFAKAVFDALTALRAGEDVPDVIGVGSKLITPDMTREEISRFYEEQYGRPLPQ